MIKKTKLNENSLKKNADLLLNKLKGLHGRTK